LNFVFRELNQEYLCVFVVRRVRLAFTNGRPGSYRPFELDEMPALLREMLDPASRGPVAGRLIGIVNQRRDHTGAYAGTLQSSALGSFPPVWNDVAIDAGGAATIAEVAAGAALEDVAFRWRPGSLGAAYNGQSPDGIVTGATTVTLRTDSVLAEALLGQADALDPYATALQDADLERRGLENARLRLANDTVQNVADPVERSQAYARVFGTGSTVSESALVELLAKVGP